MGKSWLSALAATAMLAASFGAVAQTPAPAPAAPAVASTPAPTPTPAPAAGATPAPEGAPAAAADGRPALTAEDVTKAFVEAVGICAKAAFRKQSIGQLPAADRTRVAVADERIRTFAQAPEGRPAYDVLSASGIVVITERAPNSCEVLAYGPRVRPTFERAGAALVGLGMSYVEVENGENAADIFRTYERVSATGEKISVRFIGGEPGMEGREFKFPLMNAYFSRSGGAQNFE